MMHSQTCMGTERGSGSGGVSYTYDADSRLMQVTAPTGTYSFSYDNVGRLTGTSTTYAFLSGRTLTESYSYDAASNRTGFTDPEGGATTYGYDSDNRLTSVASAASGSFSFGYDSLSRRISLTRPNGVNVNYTYDSLSRLLSVLDQSRKGTLDGAAYTYDPAGNRLSRQDYRTGTMSNFAYDAIYQLLQVTQAGQPTETYSYDDVGNRLSSLGVSPYSYDNSNELNSQPGVSYSYDANGNLISKTDSNGTTSYSWDVENRLTSVTLPGSGGTVSYQYDPFGRRIEKISPAGTTIYAYDGDNVVEELDGSGTAVARYTQGLGIDEPLAMVRGGASYYYNADGLGSITSLTSASGQIAASYTYDSFGKLTASTGTVTNPFRYTGREYGTETKLYYYRARYYDSSVGRFISEDPTRFGGGVNSYAYIRNNPINLIDPLGLSACKDKTKNCIQRALQALFPGATASVGNPTAEVGGHWNFKVQLQFSSYGSATDFYNAYYTSAQTGFSPAARFGNGPGLHLENLSPTDTWLNDNGTYTVDGTAHIDLFNPNSRDVVGVGGHVGVDGLIGHLTQSLGGNIDPARCPW